MALESMAERLKADHGHMAGGGELLEYTVKVPRGEYAIDASAEALDRLVGIELPSNAFYSARVNLAPHPDDEANYKSLNGYSMVPTDPYQNPASFATSLNRLVDNVEAKQEVLSVTIRIGIPPRGFLAIHGDVLIAGPRVALVRRDVYQEGPRGGARKVTVRRTKPKSGPKPKQKARKAKAKRR